MGRAIKVQAVRRKNGGQVEVLSAAGAWVRYSMLSEATRKNVEPWLKAYGVGTGNGTRIFPMDDFMWGTPPPNDDQGDELENIWQQQQQDQQQEQQEQQNDDQGDQDQQQNDGQNGENVTVEDIIRKIAGELDAQVAAQAVETMTDLIAMVEQGFQQKLDNFKGGGSGDGDLFQITTKIEMIDTDKKLKEHKGVFHKNFDKLVKVIASGQHAYLPGPPGTGKSHAAEQAATVLGWRFASLSLGPTTTESRLWGGMTAHGEFFEPPFVTLARHAQENPDSGSVYCLDELDNGNAGVIATLNSAMANGWFTAPNGDVITMGRNFVIIGAANTYGTGPTAEFAGRNKLDAATLDRFVYLPWDTDLGVEAALTRQVLEPAVAKAWLDVWRTCRKNAKDNGLKVFVTMRGCLNGAKLIAQGFEPTEALEMVLLNKLPDDQRRKVWAS